MVRTTELLIFVIAAALGTALLAGARPAAAQVSPVSVTFGIESVVSDVGGEAVVAVEAKDISGGSVRTWALEVSYDPTVVEAITCAVPAIGVCVVNAGIGTVEVVNLSSPAELVKDTVLATITFLCEKEGTTDLSLANRLGGIPEELPDVETEDGLITCQEPSTATATQEPAATATGTPSSGANGVSSLPDTGTGGADAGPTSRLEWMAFAVAALGVASAACFTSLFMLRRRP